MREAQKQQWRARAAQGGHAQLHVNEAPRQFPLDETREPRARAERGQVYAYDERELRHGVAEHVGGQSAREQLVDESAGRDDQDVEEEYGSSVHNDCGTAEFGLRI